MGVASEGLRVKCFRALRATPFLTSGRATPKLFNQTDPLPTAE